MIAERGVTFGTADGAVLEGRVAVPPGAPMGLAICHPHPLYGGDMDNAVVCELAELAGASGLGTLRFNFRGVGRSTGLHGGGGPEEHDVETALAYLATVLAPPAAVALAGYSFGAAVAARVAGRHRALRGLALIAPPLISAQWALPELDTPVLIVAGAADGYCPRDALDAVRVRLPTAVIHVIDGGDHFFSGTLPALAAAVRAWLTTLDAGQARRSRGAG
jgi:uncharacterized protein